MNLRSRAVLTSRHPRLLHWIRTSSCLRILQQHPATHIHTVRPLDVDHERTLSGGLRKSCDVPHHSTLRAWLSIQQQSPHLSRKLTLREETCDNQALAAVYMIIYVSGTEHSFHIDDLSVFALFSPRGALVACELVPH